MNYAWNWGVLLQKTPDGAATYVDWLISGLGWTISVALSAWVLALALGAVLGVMRTVPNKWLSGIATAYVEIFRNVPLLVQLFIWYFVVPEILPFGLGDRVKQMDPTLNAFLTSFICLGLFTAARVCEQVRAGIDSLAKGQKNAGLAMGLTLWQTYKFVLLPMAFRIVIPPLGQRVHERLQELVGRAHHRPARAHRAKPADRRVHGEYLRGLHRRHRALYRHHVDRGDDHALAGAALPRPGLHLGRRRKMSYDFDWSSIPGCDPVPAARAWVCRSRCSRLP